jgi:hypothetical protein
MPGSNGTRKDNPEPSKSKFALGARREHEPTPEGKMCSELHRNMQGDVKIPGVPHKGTLTYLEDTFMNGLSQGVYGDGTVTNSVGGLQLLVASTPTSGTVGGIDRAQWTFWRNQAWSANTNGGVTLGAANIISQMNALWVQLVRGRDYPDLIIMDNVMYRYYLQALQSIQRIGPEAVPGDMAEAGFQVLKYLNSDVVLDGGFQGFSSDPLPPQVSSSTSAVGGAPSTTGYMLNTKYLHWRPHARRNMVPLDPDRFSINQDAMVRLIGWAGNMTLSNACNETRPQTYH